MNQAQQPEALRLAEFFESMKKSSHRWYDGTPVHEKSAQELRRLHARVQELEAQQKREPLTDEQMRQVLLDTAMAAVPEDERAGVTVDEQMLEQVTLFARATELAHGITAQPEYHADDERDHSDEDAAIAAGKVQAALQGRVG